MLETPDAPRESAPSPASEPADPPASAAAAGPASPARTPRAFPPRFFSTWLFPSLLALAVIAYVGLRPPVAPEASADRLSFPPASPAARALLGDLEPGDTLAELRVDGIEGPGVEGQEPEVILVHLSRPGVRLAIAIAPRGALPHPPPEQSPGHDLFFGHVQPEDAELRPEELSAALVAVRELVAARE